MASYRSPHKVFTANFKQEPVNKKPKCSFTHYGFLLVEFWCAYGITFRFMQNYRESLFGPDSKAFLVSCLPERKDGSKWTTAVKEEHNGGNPKPRERRLSTWPCNTMWRMLLKAIDLDDSSCESAQQQFDVFTAAKKWESTESNLVSFMCLVQLWYYGVPPETVRCVRMHGCHSLPQLNERALLCYSSALHAAEEPGYA
jgi:hypothetical protein